MVLRSFYRLVVSFALCYGVGCAGALYALPMVASWFSGLKKPDFTPPAESFIPIGMFCYFLMALSLYFLWSEDPDKKDTKTAIEFFLFGLLLNFAWIYVFFGLQSPFLGLIVMIMLIAIVLSTIYQSMRVSIAAAVLLVPYFIGCIAAIIINYYIFIMNPALPIFLL